MKKQYQRYFGKNIATVIYVIGLILLAVGAAVSYFYWAGVGVPIMIVGVLIFFITSSMKISGENLDDAITEASEAYVGEKLSLINTGKKRYSESDFTVFCGYFYESGKTSFKSGRDGKVRTSRYFITAIHEDKSSFIILHSEYSFLGDEEPTFEIIPESGATITAFSEEMTDFPCKIHKCVITGESGGAESAHTFFLPDDALADSMVAQLNI